MKIIIIPPYIVSILGCSLIINQTQIGPKIVSKRKKRLTSAAVINLGAIVTSTKGIPTHIMHINGTIILSFSKSLKSSTYINATKATKNYPITAAGTKSLLFAARIILAPIARPKAVIKPRKSPKKFPNFKES